MANYKLTTVFYKYKRFAGGWIVIYALLVIVLFFLAKGNTLLVMLLVAVMLVPPLIVALRKKSIFTLRSWDDRKLTLTPDYIQVGDEQYAFADVQAVAIYLGGYKGLYEERWRNRWGTKLGKGSVVGDNNVLAFRYQGKAQSYEFFLSSYDSYAAICHIIGKWKESGKSLVLKEQFSRDHIKQQAPPQQVKE
jgi:hypothetical protein